MKIISKPLELRQTIREWRLQGKRIACVPTMGNLHAGHADLMNRARNIADVVVTTIFVNPMQFGPNEDFASYPRTPIEDQQLLTQLGVDAMFMPEVIDMYPNGHAMSSFVEVPQLGDLLCGAFRPGHFRGVATVVIKLLNLVAPDVAIFGEKDYQQLLVIRRAIADLCMPIEIIGAPTVRESDGLAMSSRNRYLSKEQRTLAATIYQQLLRTQQRLMSGSRDYVELQREGTASLTHVGFKVDYFAVCDALTLSQPTQDTREYLIATAARIGKARLIDNVRLSCTSHDLI
jgi:pantoate--beta-alanine ligase